VTAHLTLCCTGPALAGAVTLYCTEVALAGAGPNARPRRGAPLGSGFMTSSCSVNRVTTVAERRYKALARLLTFDNRGNSLVLTRAFFVNNEIYMAFLLNSQAQGLSGKNEQSTQTPLCWAPEARGQRKLHWLHRLKAGPDAVAQTCGFSFLSHFGRRS